MIWWLFSKLSLYMRNFNLFFVQYLKINIVFLITASILKRFYSRHHILVHSVFAHITSAQCHLCITETLNQLLSLCSLGLSPTFLLFQGFKNSNSEFNSKDKIACIYIQIHRQVKLSLIL